MNFCFPPSVRSPTELSLSSPQNLAPFPFLPPSPLKLDGGPDSITDIKIRERKRRRRRRRRRRRPPLWSGGRTFRGLERERERPQESRRNPRGEFWGLDEMGGKERREGDGIVAAVSFEGWSVHTRKQRWWFLEGQFSFYPLSWKWFGGSGKWLETTRYAAVKQSSRLI